MKDVGQSQRQSRRLRFLFASAMFGGNRSLFESMRDVLGDSEEFDSNWLLMDEEPPALIARIPPISRNWTLKGGLSMRSRVLALERTGLRFDAAFFNHLIPALFLKDFRRRVPTVIAMDVTPPLLDLYSRWYGVPVTSKSNPLERIKFQLTSDTYADAHYLAPWSEWTARSLRQDYHVPEGKIRVTPAGIDLSKWTPHRRDCVPGGPLRILFVGNDFVRKGGDLVLDLARRTEFSSCEFHFATHDKVHARSPNVIVHSDLAPNTDALRKLYQDCDVFILPSRGDLSPVAILEAMAMELPVISTDIGGISELIKDGSTGFLVPPDDGRRLASCLRTLLGDCSLRLRLGEQARRRIEERFDLHKLLRAVVTYLKEAADSGARGGGTASQQQSGSSQPFASSPPQDSRHRS